MYLIDKMAAGGAADISIPEKWKNQTFDGISNIALVCAPVLYKGHIPDAVIDLDNASRELQKAIAPEGEEYVAFMRASLGKKFDKNCTVDAIPILAAYDDYYRRDQ